jgi:predicted dehydrogenase
MTQDSPHDTVPASGVSRRDFLRTGVAAGAGILLGRASASAVDAPAILTGASKVLNLALVGTGAQGRVLIDAALPIPNIKFQAVCDIWDYSLRYGERYLGRNGHTVRPYVDFQEMLEKEKDIDAVIVATPDFMHAPHSIAAMEAGHHVYCEKLMSNTIEGARSMVHAAQRTGKLLQIGHQRRSNPRYIHARDRIVRGDRLLGRVTNINGQWNRAVSDDLGWPPRNVIPDATLAKYGYESMHEFRNWRWFRKYGGGPISDLGAHQIDIYNWMLDMNPTSVMAGGGVDFYENHEWDDNVMAILEYPTPEGMVRAFYQVLTTTSAGGGYWEYFMGTEGALKMSENPNLTAAYREARAPDWSPHVNNGIVRPATADIKVKKPWEKPKPTGGTVDVRETAQLEAWDLPVKLDKAIHQPHLENFFSAIRHGTPLACPAEVAFASSVTILKINDAVAAGAKLPYTPSDFIA